MSVTNNYQTKGGSSLPTGGAAGQILASDGAGNGVWIGNDSPLAGLGWQVGQIIGSGHRGQGVLSVGSASFGAGQINYSLFYVPVAMTISELGINVTAAGGNARLGIFTFDGGAMVATLVQDVGALSVATTGYKGIPSLAIAVTPGWYAAAVNLDSATSLTTYTAPTSYADTTAGTPWTALNTTVAYGAFAASYTVANNIWNSPLIFIRRGS